MATNRFIIRECWALSTFWFLSFFASIFQILIIKRAPTHHPFRYACCLYVILQLFPARSELAFSDFSGIRADFVTWFGQWNAGLSQPGILSTGLWRPFILHSLGTLLTYLENKLDWPAAWWETTLSRADPPQWGSLRPASPKLTHPWLHQGQSSMT